MITNNYVESKPVTCNITENLRPTAKAIFDELKREYVNSGYYSSGAISLITIGQNIKERRNFVMAAGIKELIDAGLINKKHSRSTSYILSAPIRKQLIEEFSLCEKWLTSGIAKNFSPNGKNGEITKVFTCCG